MCCPEFATQDISLFLKHYMGKGGYKVFDKGGMYFVSFAVVSEYEALKS